MHKVEDVKAAVKAAVDRYPNRRNPTEPGSTKCINTGVSGKCHCIAAQVLVDFGYEVTKYGEDFNDSAIEGTLVHLDLTPKFTRAAADYLAEVQGVFDDRHNGRAPGRRISQTPRKWASCFRDLLQREKDGDIYVEED